MCGADAPIWQGRNAIRCGYMGLPLGTPSEHRFLELARGRREAAGIEGHYRIE